MFADIAPRYDLANDVLSLGMHRLWRKKVVDIARRKNPRAVLDLCCGTGDLAFALSDQLPNARVVGLDFVRAMLDCAEGKRADHRTVEFLHGDAVSIPFADSTFELVTIAFGIRNIPEIDRCLDEIARVLVPGGSLIILEFGQVRIPLLRQAYDVYGRHVMPLIGKALTGNRAAYEYLPETSLRFPAGAGFVEILTGAGFQADICKPLFGGLSYIYAANNSRLPVGESSHALGNPVI